MNKKDFFAKIKNEYPSDIETEGTKTIIKLFNINKKEQLTKLYMKNDVSLLACVIENFINESINDFDLIHLHSVSLPGYIWQGGLKGTDIKLQTLEDKDMIFYNVEKLLEEV